MQEITKEFVDYIFAKAKDEIGDDTYNGTALRKWYDMRIKDLTVSYYEKAQDEMFDDDGSMENVEG